MEPSEARELRTEESFGFKEPAKNSSVGELSTMKFELSSNVTDKSERVHSQQTLGFNYYVPSTGR